MSSVGLYVTLPTCTLCVVVYQVPGMLTRVRLKTWMKIQQRILQSDLKKTCMFKVQVCPQLLIYIYINVNLTIFLLLTFAFTLFVYTAHVIDPLNYSVSLKIKFGYW